MANNKISTARAVGHAVKGLAEMAGRSGSGTLSDTVKKVKKRQRVTHGYTVPGAKHHNE